MQTSTKFILAVLCVAMVGLVSISANPLADLKSEQARPKLPGPNEEEPLIFGPGGSLHLAGNECGKDEVLAEGHLPSCEPTCDDPKPICFKTFFTSLDYVPCFCKAPLVRNLKTKQCVIQSECPPKTPLRFTQV